MDVQRKKGILEVCVLAVLKKGPSYGYLIIRELEQCVEISESTLYPILKRLEQNGSLTTYRREYNGRMRKYYQLTEEGQKKIDCFLVEWEELQMMYRFIEQQNEQMPVEVEETGLQGQQNEQAPGEETGEAQEMADAERAADAEQAVAEQMADAEQAEVGQPAIEQMTAEQQEGIES